MFISLSLSSLLCLFILKPQPVLIVSELILQEMLEEKHWCLLRTCQVTTKGVPRFVYFTPTLLRRLAGVGAKSMWGPTP